MELSGEWSVLVNGVWDVPTNSGVDWFARWHANSHCAMSSDHHTPSLPLGSWEMPMRRTAKRVPLTSLRRTTWKWVPHSWRAGVVTALASVHGGSWPALSW